MSSKDNSGQKWSDPKDYGLPYVEITPLKSSQKGQLISEEEEKSVLTEAVKASTANQVPQEAIAVPFKQEDRPKVLPKIAPEKVAQKKSKSWIYWVVSLAVIVVLVIIWQMQFSGDKVPVQVSSVNSILPEIVEENPIISTDGTISQDLENQSTEGDSINSAPIGNQNPETGTTIDLKGEGSLVRIESKLDRPTYFIVVGSLPSEKLALEEYTQYSSRASTVYLIEPYDDVKNYRLAIGSYESFAKASQELDRIKADYTEALWILKY